MPPVPNERNSTQRTAALRDFDPAYVSSSSSRSTRPRHARNVRFTFNSDQRLTPQRNDATRGNRGLILPRAPAHGGEIFLGAVGAFAVDSYAARAWGAQPIAPRRLRFSAGPRLPEPHERSCSRGF